MKLVIKGHAIHGKKVIEILEMLGGKNIHRIDAIRDYCVYFVMDDKNKTISSLKLNQVLPEQFIIYSLEEFLEKFPYKVGDKVWLHYENLTIRTTETIISMRWCSKHDCVLYDVCTCCNLKEYAFTPYKEETNMKTDCKKCGLRYGSVRCFDMDYCPNHKPKSNAVGLKDGEVIECEVNKETDMVEDNYCETLETKVFGYKIGDIIFTNNAGWIRITNKLWDCYAKNYTYEGIGWLNKQEYDNISHKDITCKIEEYSIELDKVTDKNNCGINCPDGYEFYDDNGNLIGNKIIMRPKKPTYPKTYEECCEIVKVGKEHTLEGEIIRINNYKIDLFESFQKLLICRNAYWQIAGEELGLNRPWEPNYDSGVNKYGIICMNGVVQESNPTTNWERHLNKVLDFPTAEMRDTFYENFKDLIEQCKELL